MQIIYFDQVYVLSSYEVFYEFFLSFIQKLINFQLTKLKLNSIKVMQILVSNVILLLACAIFPNMRALAYILKEGAVCVSVCLSPNSVTDFASEASN